VVNSCSLRKRRVTRNVAWNPNRRPAGASADVPVRDCIVHADRKFDSPSPHDSGDRRLRFSWVWDLTLAPQIELLREVYNHMKSFNVPMYFRIIDSSELISSSMVLSEASCQLWHSPHSKNPGVEKWNLDSRVTP
jgi:hypothetical protein